MTIVRQTGFEGGSGGAIATVSTAGLDATHDAISGGSNVTFTTTAAHGSLGLAISSSGGYVRVNAANSGDWPTVSGRVYFRCPSTSPGLEILTIGGNSFGPAGAVWVNGAGAGKLSINDATGGGGALWTSTVTVQPNTWYRLEWIYDGTNLTVRWFLGDSFTPIETSAACDITISTVVAADFLAFGPANGQARAVILDDLQINSPYTDGYPGPFLVPVSGNGALLLLAAASSPTALPTGAAKLDISGTGSALDGYGGHAAVTVDAVAVSPAAAIAATGAVSVQAAASALSRVVIAAATGALDMLGRLTTGGIQSSGSAVLSLLASGFATYYRRLSLLTQTVKDRWLLMFQTTQTVEATAGAAEFVSILISEVTGQDISADTVLVSLGGELRPSGWSAPDRVVHPSVSTVEVSKLVTNTTPPGTYWMWAKIADSPETVVRSATRVIVH